MVPTTAPQVTLAKMTATPGYRRLEVVEAGGERHRLLLAEGYVEDTTPTV